MPAVGPDRSTPDPAPLAARAVVYAPSPEVAVELARAGAPVVVVDPDARVAGEVAAAVTAAGGRAAVFTGPVEAGALAAMLEELLG